MLKIINRLILFFSCAVLFGCKADILETRLTTSDIKKSMSGKLITVPFSAVIQVIGDDASTRAQVKRYERIIENYVDVEDFEISKSMMGMQIKVLGNIPLLSGNDLRLDGKHPWAIHIKKTANRTLKKRYPYRMSLKTTDYFPSFKSEFSKLNIMLSPDPYQPLLMKIRNKDQSMFRVFTGSVEIQGRHHSIYEGEVAKRVSLKMKGGVYDHTAPVIFFGIE
ncbi:MAG: hypothetical protein CFH41_02570 [Alphaproteobacteria bacterium MarineAlpha11_Bin1]|nr:MAG: hypothetical protein CFH41_02570 [Alphaproteobacteria bacterium MarineAlpha11_Bin1]